MTPRQRNESTERRKQARGGVTEPSRPQLVTMVIGTFREMPGLSLHLNQAARLFGVRAETCRILLDDLVAQGRLRRAHDGQYLGRDLAGRLAAPTPMPNYSWTVRGH